MSPVSPMYQLESGGFGIRHMGRGMLGVRVIRAWIGRVRVRQSPTRSHQGG